MNNVRTLCPKCNRPQYAPHCGNADCNPCNERKPPEGELYQVWSEDGEALSCPYCGFTACLGYWEDRDFEMYVLFGRGGEQ